MGVCTIPYYECVMACSVFVVMCGGTRRIRPFMYKYTVSFSLPTWWGPRTVSSFPSQWNKHPSKRMQNKDVDWWKTGDTLQAEEASPSQAPWRNRNVSVLSLSAVQCWCGCAPLLINLLVAFGNCYYVDDLVSHLAGGSNDRHIAFQNSLSVEYVEYIFGFVLVVQVAPVWF